MRFTIPYILFFASIADLTFGQQMNIPEKIDILLLDAKFQEAIEFIDAQPTTILLQNKKAETLTRWGKLNEADKLLTEIQGQLNTSPDNFYQAITLTNLGFLQVNQGRNDLAEETLKKALSLFQQSGHAGNLEESQALINLGLVYMATGKYSQAEEQIQMALSSRLARLNVNHALIAATYNDLGLVYSQLDKDKALDYYEKAQSIYISLYGDAHPKIATININIGIIYLGQKLYGDAVNNFESALKIWDDIYPQAHPAKAIALFNLGQTYLNMNNEKAAMEYYERAYTMYVESFGPQHPEVANVLNAIGNLHLAQHNFSAALNAYQKALQANVTNFTSNDLSVNPPLKNYYNGLRLLQTLLFKAQAFEFRYLSKSLKFKDLKESLKVLSVCDSLIDQLRQHSTNESDKILLGTVANEVYSDGVRIAYEAGTNAIRKRTYLEKAFYFAEKSKGAVLLDAIANADAKAYAGIPTDLLEEEKSLKSSITLTAQKLAQKPSLDEERYLRETLFSLNRNYEDFIKKLENQYPEYFNLKFNATSPTIPDIQKLLKDNQEILSYFSDEKSNHLYVFQITKRKYRIADHALSKDFDRYITGLRNGLFFIEMKTYKLSAFELGRLLIPRIPSSIDELVILPTGRLGIIPFETLLTKKAEKVTGFANLPYLLNRFSIQYDFSAGLILQKARKEKSAVVPSILLCAPVTFPEEEDLPQLPGTETEVHGIEQLFTEKNMTSTSFLRLEADESLVKSNRLKEYNLLHFATHGVVDETYPELSRIFLQSNSEAEDGKLYAGEIYNLDLNANLVTLSACQTGLGKIFKGEGVIGLSRALVYAGAQNIMVSFWSVADESTSILMKTFYQNLLNTPATGYASNLRKAKLEMITKDKYAAPYYWAPFIIIGF